MTLGEKALPGIVKKLLGEPGVRGCAIITRDGLPHDMQIPGAVNDEILAAMIATAQGAAETAAFELGAGDAEAVRITAQRVTLVVLGAGREHLLVIVLHPDADADAATEKAKGLLAG